MKKKRTAKGSMTAAELTRKLNGDPEFVARRVKEERQRVHRAEESRRAEAPLVEELARSGLLVDSVWDLVNTATPYPQALPILLNHLVRPYPSTVKEGIARALAVPEARFGWPLLTRLYREEQDERVKEALAVAIAANADDKLIGDVIALTQDSRHGPSRLLLLSALERSKEPRALAALKELGTDPDLQKEVQSIVRRKRSARR